MVYSYADLVYSHQTFTGIFTQGWIIGSLVFFVIDVLIVHYANYVFVCRSIQIKLEPDVEQ